MSAETSLPASMKFARMAAICFSEIRLAAANLG